MVSAGTIRRLARGFYDYPKSHPVIGTLAPSPDAIAKAVGRIIDEKEQTAARRLRRRASWESLVGAAEQLKGGPWAQWAERHRDWGRDGVLYVAVRHGGLPLVEVSGSHPS